MGLIGTPVRWLDKTAVSSGTYRLDFTERSPLQWNCTVLFAKDYAELHSSNLVKAAQMDKIVPGPSILLYIHAILIRSYRRPRNHLSTGRKISVRLRTMHR